MGFRNYLFKSAMSRERFKNLLRYWHFVGDREQNHRLSKINLLLDHLNDTMKTIYTADKSLSLDESMVLWRGRLLFRQYIKNKRHKYGVKLFQLCTSNGIILRTSVYCGLPYADKMMLGLSAAVVLHLMADFPNMGYYLYTDNYYNSLALRKEFTKRKTYQCGTLQGRRRGTPKDLVDKKLKKGDHVWKRNGEFVVCKWKDKK